jgi:hypothetical protein
MNIAHAHTNPAWTGSVAVRFPALRSGRAAGFAALQSFIENCRRS